MKKKLPRVGLALIAEEGFRAAASPLFEEGIVDVVEWTVDDAWAFGPFQVPEWANAVIDLYSNAGCLYGHGVAFSPLSARWERRHEQWLKRLARELKERRYVCISEHFGFMSARGFLPSAPLPVPMTKASVQAGREALARLSDVVGAATGLENLASVLGRRDSEIHGEFLEALLDPGDGFLLLDLHNVYCQSNWMGVPFKDLVKQLPLHRVREIHVAGGRTWTPPLDPEVVLHCDTHDGPVPNPVFEMLPFALKACKNLEAVIFERFAYTLDAETNAEQFREDYRHLRRTVEACHA